jgi:phosphoribosylaminoimidazole-succinocarboxamide synthase
MDFTKPRYTPMSRRRRIYEGKAKVLYEGPEPGTLIQHFKDDATAFNAKKHQVIEGKGVLNNRISEYVFQHLNDIGVPTHFIRRLNMREQLIREVEIIPLEVVVRNVAAGSLSQRLGIEEGTQLPRSVIEFYYKNDQLNDPMVSEEHITAFGWATPQEIDDIMSLAIRVNDFLSGLFLGVGIRLVDFKMETGRLWENDVMRIVVADEISPDSCRLWDIKSNEKLDKDRFRRDLGGLLEAYTEVAKRLGIMSEGDPGEGLNSGARSVGVPTIKTGPMTVEEYFAFTDTRPDNEKWELIDGEPILNASPSNLHQAIVFNLAALLGSIQHQKPQSWEAAPGVGVRMSDTSLPEPDLFIRPAGTARREPYSRETRDVLVVFEIISPSTAERDLRWKRTAYTSLPSLTHYIVIAQDAVDVVVFARETGFAERHYRSLADTLELPSLGISLPLSEIYRDTGLK